MASLTLAGTRLVCERSLAPHLRYYERLVTWRGGVEWEARKSRQGRTWAVAMNDKHRNQSSGQPKTKPKRSPVRSTSGTWWPYAIAGGVVVLVAAFVAVTQLGHVGSGGAAGAGAGLAVGSPVPTDSVPSSGGGTVSLADFRGSKVVVYFYEGGA